MAAIIGKSKIMNAAQKTFISSTYWTDRIGPTAALATLKKHKKLDVSSHLVYIGNLVQEGWKNLAKKYDLNINITGIPPLSHWQIETGDSQLLHTIVVEKMIERGFLTSNAFYATYAHTKEHVNSYLNALNDVLGELVPYIKDSKLRAIYQKPIAHTGFRRLT